MSQEATASVSQTLKEFSSLSLRKHDYIDPFPPLDAPYPRSGKAAVFAIGCTHLALDSAAGTHPSHLIPRTSRTLSSEPTDLLEPQPLGICPKRRLFSLVLQVDFALPKGSTPPHFPAGIPTECRTGFTETVANGTQAPKAPWTHCLSLGFWLLSHGSSPSLLPWELAVSLVPVLPVPSGRYSDI